MFIAVLFTIAKLWKKPKCPSVDEWVKKAVALLNNGKLLGHKKEEILTICDNMDGPRRCYAQ